MKTNPYPAPSHPTASGLVNLQIRSSGLIKWLGPAWATLCGVTASGRWRWQGEEWLKLVLLILLVDVGWGTLWAALGGTDWASPLQRWRNWHSGNPVSSPPYTLPGTPGDRLSRWLGQLRTWWREIFWPSCGSALSTILVAIPVTIALGILVGPESLLLNVAALAIMQLQVAFHRGKGKTEPEWDAIIGVTLPWLVGHLTFGTLTLDSVGLAMAFALSWGAAWRVETTWGRIVEAISQLLAATILISLHHPLAASGLLLLVVPQMVLFPWLSRGQSASWYMRHAQPWLMAGMLVAAWAL